jgi:hypothetical protein
VDSWILGVVWFLGWAFLAFIGIIVCFWLVMVAVQAGVWLKERFRGGPPDDR